MYKDKGRVATPTTSVGLHSRPTRPLLRPGEQPTLGRPEATSTSAPQAACAGRGDVARALVLARHKLARLAAEARSKAAWPRGHQDLGACGSSPSCPEGSQPHKSPR